MEVSGFRCSAAPLISYFTLLITFRKCSPGFKRNKSVISLLVYLILSLLIEIQITVRTRFVQTSPDCRERILFPSCTTNGSLKKRV